MSRGLAGDLEATVRVDDAAALGEAFGPVLNALAERMEGEDPLPSLMILRLRDASTRLGSAVLRLALSGKGETVGLEGAYAVNDPEPEAFAREFLLQVAATCGDLAMEPFSDDLGPHVKALVRLEDEKRLVAACFALWESRGGKASLLVSSTAEGLRRMVEAASDEAKRHRFDGPPSGLIEAAFSLSREFVEAEDLFTGRRLSGEGRLVFLAAVDREAPDWLLRLRTNAWELLAADEEKGRFRPLGATAPLVGADPLIAVAAGHGALFSDETLSPLFETGEMSDLLGLVGDLLPLTGNEVKALLDGPLAFAVAGRARSPLGETPGAYLLFQPSSADLAEKVVARVCETAFPILFGEVEAPGWSRAVSLRAFADVTVAAGEGRLLVGFLSPSQLALTPTTGSPFKEILDPENLGGLYVSVRELDESVGELLSRLSLLGADVEGRVEVFRTFAAEVDAFSIRIVSPGEMLVRVVPRQTGEER